MEHTGNLFDLLPVSPPEQAESPFLFWKDHAISRRQIEYAARKVAGGLKALGIEKGDRVAVMLPNIPPSLFILQGVHLLGAILVPVHIFTRSMELGYLLDDSEAKILFSWSGYGAITGEAAAQTESLRQRIEVDADPESNVEDFNDWLRDAEPYEGESTGGNSDIALIHYTAGVTGRPKGAMLSHANILYNTEETLRALKVRPQDHLLGVIPFCHPFGNTLQWYMALRSGATLTIQTRFDPVDTLEKISSQKVNVFIGLPVHYSTLLEAEGVESEPGKLAFAVSGGGPLDAGTVARFENIFNTRISTVYGTCETSPTIAVNAAHLEETPRSAWGRPVSGVEVRVVDENGVDLPADTVGEIIVRSPGVFKGYWNRPDATNIAVDDDGWFHTSDLGRIDLNGFIWGVGRLHDRINKGGFSVYPREVEGVLNAHPSVYASAVIGTPDPQLGEEILAYIVPRGGMPINEQELINYCSERLAQYKAPRRVVVVDKLPRSPNGIVLRRALRTGFTPKNRDSGQYPRHTAATDQAPEHPDHEEDSP